ncbi:MAG TPA: hypothetical protein VGB27_10205, partial [Candidatus Binatia bacterium]
MKRRLYGSIMLLAILIGSSVSVPCFAATVQEVIKKVSALPPAQRKKALEDGARQEGQFVFYTSVSAQDNPR